MKKTSYKNLNSSQKKLLDAAEGAMKNGFNPGSGFKVGAAVLTKKGTIYTGANMNISSTGLISCAEVAAFLNANTNGERNFKALAIIAQSGEKNLKEPNMPCGKCCQIIHEFNELQTSPMQLIYSNTKKDRIIIADVSDFLPHPFVSRLFRK